MEKEKLSKKKIKKFLNIFFPANAGHWEYSEEKNCYYSCCRDMRRIGTSEHLFQNTIFIISNKEIIMEKNGEKTIFNSFEELKKVSKK